MDTLKTAVVVVLLLAVLYGVYVVLNKPEPLPQDLSWGGSQHDPALQIELGTPQAPLDNPYQSSALSGSSTTPTQLPLSGTTEPAYPSPLTATSDQNSSEQSALPSPSIAAPAIPTPTTIAAPDLLRATDADMESSASSAYPLPTETASLPAASETTQESPANLATQTSYDTAANVSDSEVPRERAGEFRTTPAAVEPEPSPVDSLPSTSESTQANVNDFADKTPTSGGSSSFDTVMPAVHQSIERGAWREALLQLSPMHNDPGLSRDQRQQVFDLLDPLAGKVVYSTEHLIEAAYLPQADETLTSIAERHEVPWQLLANINGIDNPATPLAGRQLKVVRGPFRAEVSLSQNELTLFADKLYAGRFAITVGADPAPQPGEYRVQDKQPGRTYYAGDGQTVSIDDPSNPYGRVWIDLGGSLCIHGSSPNASTSRPGCIALNETDASDIYSILSQGSSVTIRR